MFQLIAFVLLTSVTLTVFVLRKVLTFCILTVIDVRFVVLSLSAIDGNSVNAIDGINLIEL